MSRRILIRLCDRKQLPFEEWPSKERDACWRRDPVIRIESRRNRDAGIDARAGMIKGGQSGPAVVPGHSERSLLIRLVSGGDRARVMPARGKRLTATEVALLGRWIDDSGWK